MLCSDRVIVFNYTRFSDSSVILHAFSKQHGRISLMVFGLGGKGKTKLGAFHPLALLDVVYSYKPGRDIQKLREYKLNPPLISCSSDIRKSTLLMFLSEISSKCIREETSDLQLFTFFETAVEFLEQIDQGLQSFHLAFLVKMSRYLGFSPDENALSQHYFDLILGHGTNNQPSHKYYLHQDMFRYFFRFYTVGFHELESIKISRNERDLLLEASIAWYGFHVSGLKTINSYPVLKEVFI
jgi:DNA repair protein RecO (recombination protein O)